MHLSSTNDHISCLRISEMQSNWFTVFICLNNYSSWWLSTLLIHITVVFLPFCCLTEPDILMYFASSLSYSSAAQGLWLMTTYSSQATGLCLLLHPFLFSLLHPSKLYLLHIDICAKSLFFGLSHSLALTISASPLLACPLILHPCPSFYHLFFCLHIHCHYLYLPASSPSLLFAQKIILFISLTQDFTRKWSVNLDTLMETLLLDFHGFAWSQSYMDNMHGNWISLLTLLVSPVHSPPSSHVFSYSHYHLFPVTATPLWHRYFQLHSKPFSLTLTSFWMFLCDIDTINGSL